MAHAVGYMTACTINIVVVIIIIIIIIIVKSWLRHGDNDNKKYIVKTVQ